MGARSFDDEIAQLKSRDLEMVLARTRHQKIARPSRDCSNNLEMELLQLRMIFNY